MRAKKILGHKVGGLGMSSFVGRVERGAFASGLSGFGVVPVHPPFPYAARIRRPSRAPLPRHQAIGGRLRFWNRSFKASCSSSWIVFLS